MLKEYLRQKIKNEDDSYYFPINRQYNSLHHVIDRNWHTFARVGNFSDIYSLNIVAKK
jgi:hypothetical protein